jgi:acyl-CoA synthetase (AMP-forming)/AMP-acid ligase II
MKRALGKTVVGNILTTAAIRYHDEPAIYCSSNDRRFSFGAVDDRVNRLAQALLGLGFRKGDVVAFLTTNRAEIVEIYFALARTGIVGLPLNYRLAEPEIVELMRAMNATTGLPKSYILTQYNNATLGPMFQAFDMTRDDVVMTVFPIFGRTGFARIIGAMLYGVPNVLANFEPNERSDF